MHLGCSWAGLGMLMGDWGLSGVGLNGFLAILLGSAWGVVVMHLVCASSVLCMVWWRWYRGDRWVLLAGLGELLGDPRFVLEDLPALAFARLRVCLGRCGVVQGVVLEAVSS